MSTYGMVLVVVIPGQSSQMVYISRWLADGQMVSESSLYVD